MAGGRIGVGYLAIPVWIWIGRWIIHGIGVDPVGALSVDIDVSIVAPSAAVILENMPAWRICEEPSLVPAGTVDISCILSIQHTAWIPLIEPDAAHSGAIHPQRKVGVKIAACHSPGRVGDIEIIGCVSALWGYYHPVDRIDCSGI